MDDDVDDDDGVCVRTRAWNSAWLLDSLYKCRLFYYWENPKLTFWLTQYFSIVENR